MTVAAPDKVGREVLLARAYLARVAEPPAPALVAFVAEVGPVEAAARVRRGAVGQQVAAETATRRHSDRAAADLDAAGQAGARLLVPEHQAWPHQAFTAFTAPGVGLVAPLALWVRGALSPADNSAAAVAVVGALAASSYGMHMAGDLAANLARAGVTIVASAGLGIDGAAHRGALAADGRTVAVLACGIDRADPSAHAALLEQIAAAGLIVTEYPPGSVPGRHRHLTRSRLVAALASATVVVEAARRSGALHTAFDARRLRRPVMAVPGPATSATSAGCHALIRDRHATLVTCAQDVVADSEPPF